MKESYDLFLNPGSSHEVLRVWRIGMPQENEGVLRSPFKSWVLPGSLEGVEDWDAPGK